MSSVINNYREQLERQIAPLRARFDALQQREQLLVAVCGVFLALTLIYLVLWSPLAGARVRAEKNLEQSRSVAQRLEVVAAAQSAGQSAGTAGPLVSRDASLLSAVDLASKNGTLNKPLSNLQPDGDTQVRVRVEQVKFDALLQWLNELQTRYGVRVDSLDVEKQPTPGLVNARMTLVRGS